MKSNFKGFGTPLEKCLGFAFEDAEKDIVLLEAQYDAFKNTYNTYSWQHRTAKELNALDPQFQFAWKEVLAIKGRFDRIFEKLGFDKPFIKNLWDKSCWKYFPSGNAITKKYITIFVDSNYPDTKKDINYLLTPIRFFRNEIPVCSVKELYSILLGSKLKAHSIRDNSLKLLDLSNQLKKLMKDEDFEEVMYCLLIEKDWKAIYTTFANNYKFNLN